MKRIMTILIAIIMSLSAISMLGCGKPEKDGKTEIKVSVYAAGYGKGWIEEACRLYESEHTNIKFVIEAKPDMFETIRTRLNANVCDSDIILVANGDYRSFVAKNYLEDLTDIYGTVIPDTASTKVQDVVPLTQREFRKVNDKTYGIPWQDATSSGFIYNKKMFAANNWLIPETMDEYWDLCDEIAKTGVAPLTFGGGQQNAYVTSMLNQWFTEYYGYEYINDTFLKYESPEQYDYTYAGRLKVYETTAKLFNGKTASGKNIALSGSKAFTAMNAQKEFAKGNAAMTICGQWFPTEMAKTLQSYPNFEYGYMPVPHINADKKDSLKNDSSMVRYSLDGNVLAIPTKSNHKEIAKDFLVSMFTKKSYQTFVEQNNGLLRPINIEVDSSKFNGFTKESYDYYIKGKKANQFVYEVSLSPMAIKGYLALLISQNGNAIGNLLNAKDYASAMAVASTAAGDDYSRALGMWDASKNNWKDAYLGAK